MRDTRETALRIRDVMTRNPLCCTPDTSVAIAAWLMCGAHNTVLPVVSDLLSLIPIGILTEHDIIRSVVAVGKSSDVLVRDCMETPAFTIGEDASVRECARLLGTHEVAAIIVVDADGACHGLVVPADLAIMP